jgi:RNAse (barnase) inhibitor barstar
MREIVLDADDWQEPADFLTALKAALGAPDGLAMDLDSFADSMIWGDENQLEPPYKIRIVNADAAPGAVMDDIALLTRMVADARIWRRDHEGTDVGVRILLGAEESH